MASGAPTQKRGGDCDPSTGPDAKKSKTMSALESSIPFDALDPSLLFEAFQHSISIPLQKAHIFAAWTEFPRKPDFLSIQFRWIEARAMTHELLIECSDHFGQLRPRIRYEDMAQAAVTFGALREKSARAGRHELALEAARREMHYLMIMCLRYDQQLHLVPDCMRQVDDALCLMEKAVGSRMPSLPSNAPSHPAAHSGTTTPEPSPDDGLECIRLKVQQARQDLGSTEVVHLDKLFGVATAVDLLRGCLRRLNFASLTDDKARTGDGILLHGVQGTGKSALAIAFAKEANWAFYDITSNSVFAKYVGDSEAFIRILFEEVERTAPSILFIDEMDGILRAPSSENGNMQSRILSEFKKRWSDLRQRRIPLLIIGATTKPWDIDLAGFGGHFKTRIHVRPPNQPARRQILESCMEDVFHTLSEDDFERLSHMSDGLTGDDLQVVLETLMDGRLREIERADRFTQMQFQGRTVCVPWVNTDDTKLNVVNKKFNDFTRPFEQVKYRPFNFADWRTGIRSFGSTTTPEMWSKNLAFANAYSINA